MNEYDRKYYQIHKDKCLEYQRNYHQIHKAECNKRSKNYRRTIVGHLNKCFHDAKQRCTDPEVDGYEYYGGRGIKCLFKSSNEFINYVINELQIDPRGLQIDRIDTNGHYEKGNIRFVTAKVNANNRRKRRQKQ